MRSDIINYLEKEIKSRCESKNNFFGEGIFYHIKAVAENAAYLADKYGADMEIVVIAAWLHDIASITDYSLYEDHHIHGAEMAEEILNGFEYDKDKIKAVKKCILNHRGSKPAEKQSAEEMCVADADAVSHFDSVPSLFYLAYVKRGLGIHDGIDFVKSKLERSYEKLSEQSKAVYENKYKDVIKIIG
ncbi:MAG: HD domain-containing protein [Oscillospiraceae bacterium]|nr:HD domain-containing protein [Oscillospiraceae bacterium]